MLSKLVKDKIHHRFGQEIRYPKDCEPLAQSISEVCKTRISASTLRRLYGFVKGIREPRLYTLDIVAEYLGYKGWDQLIATFQKDREITVKILERLKPEQIRKGETVELKYQPGKAIELKKVENVFVVVSTNDKRLQLNDEVKFTLLELHYPLIFSHLIRDDKSLGKVQLAMVSGVTSIRKL